MTNIDKNSFSLMKSGDDMITGDLYSPAGQVNLPLLIVLHGFKGFKDWGFIPYICEKFAGLNVITMCFNFSHNGISKNSEFIELPEKFASNTVSTEIDDLFFVIDSFIDGKVIDKVKLQEVWNGQIFLFGSSLGGGVAIVAGYEDKRIDRVAAWASVGKFDRYTPHQKSIWKKSGFYEFPNSRTGQILRLNSSYADDLGNNKQRFDINKITAGFSKPLLFVHGGQDVTIPLAEIEELVQKSSNDNLKLEIIPNTGHTFGIEHPFNKPTKALEKAMIATINFFGLK